MEEVKNNWCLIPNYIWKHPELSLVEKCLLGRIIALSTETRFCYAGNSYLAEELGKSAGTISNIISSLVERGFLNRDVIRNSKSEVEQRRLWIDEQKIRSIFCEIEVSKNEVSFLEKMDTPIHENVDTLSMKSWIPIHEIVEDRIDIRRDIRKDIYKQTKKAHNTEETQEHIEILNHYASLFSPHRPVKDKTWYKNATHWLKTYSLEEIKEAISNWYKYPHWSKEGSSKNGLSFLFRLKNKNGEANYIEEMLQLGGGSQVPDKKKLASLKFEEMWKDVI